MDPLAVDAVDAVVREMLDGMRNAHLQMVIGDPYRAIECLEGAAEAHQRLAVLFHEDAGNEVLAGRILYQVIEQRMEALRSLAKEALNSPMTSAEVVASVAKPLDAARAASEVPDGVPTQEPPIG
ncbi:MAG: hypothetical protein ABI607_03250 [Betaproteobacteria bacterium]